MMPIKYICLDDAYDEVGQIATRLTDGMEDLEIEVRSPHLFDEEIERILPNQPDGMIIDLRLDEYPNEQGQLVKYRAMSLAQELRTRMTEGTLSSGPIILWSSDKNFSSMYKPDQTGHDLFDLVLHKGSLTDQKVRIQSQLKCLVEGYRTISSIIADKAQSERQIEAMLGLGDGQELPDVRLGEELVNRKKTPAHDHAHYLMTNVVLPNGFLIDEDTLAARLGVDVSQSEGWETFVKEQFTDIKYTGVFSEAWPRWWMPSVRSWWHQVVGSSSALERLPANKRLQIILDKFGEAGLVVPREKDTSIPTKYWHICKAEGIPIDPDIAVQVGFDGNAPLWSDGEYVSLRAVLERKHIEAGLKVHPLERDRVRSVLKG